MHEKGLISAIIPTFNRGKFLLDRIKELMNQDYSNFEIIIVDDCSTDDTQEILKGIKNDKIKVIKLNKNSGCVSIPRNIGICAAKGEFIAPIDDDVISLPNKFKALISSFKDEDVIVYGNRYEYKNNKVYISDKITNWNPLNGWGVDNSQMIYRANVYDRLSLIFPSKACDWYTAKHIAPLGSIRYIDEYVSIYVWHETNRSSNKEKIKISPKDYLSFYTNSHDYKFDFDTEYN